MERVLHWKMNGRIRVPGGKAITVTSQTLDRELHWLEFSLTSTLSSMTHTTLCSHLTDTFKAGDRSALRYSPVYGVQTLAFPFLIAEYDVYVRTDRTHHPIQ